MDGRTSSARLCPGSGVILPDASKPKGAWLNVSACMLLGHVHRSASLGNSWRASSSPARQARFLGDRAAATQQHQPLGLGSTEKAHEDAVKQCIDFGLFLLQVLNNKRSLRSVMNRASPCQINIPQGNNKHGQIIFLSAPV